MDSTHNMEIVAENYEVKIPIRAGVVAGLFGALSIIVVVTAILLFNGKDIGMAARLIATTVYGSDAMVGFMPIIIGTIIHLVMGSLLGAIFARLIPRMPRAIWILAGIGFGTAAFVISTFIVLPLIAQPMIAEDANKSILLIAHMIYGAVLGLGGAGYQLWWHLPLRWQPNVDV